VKKTFFSFLIAASALLFVSNTGQAQEIHPTPFFCSFQDGVSTYNGRPLPVGTLVSAFDPDGILCGYFVVHTAGSFGYMPVYGDDSNSPEDEGAIHGQMITFRINGRLSTVSSGDATWTNQSLKQVSLSATATVGLSAITLPTNRAGTYDDTVKFEMQIRNDGNGIDFYDINASADNGNFVTLPQDSAFYADPSEIISLYFEIETPTFTGGGDTVITIDYEVISAADPTVKLTGSVDLFFTITDAGDPDITLPSGFTLMQNYPNPFNPTTTIAFNIPSSTTAQLEIFNVIGQTVEVMDLGRLGAGEHQIQYDASALASGVYFYRLTTEQTHQSKKMILLK